MRLKKNFERRKCPDCGELFIIKKHFSRKYCKQCSKLNRKNVVRGYAF